MPSCQLPGLVLVAFATVFTFSTLVIGPAFTGNDASTTDTATPAEGVDHHGHEEAGDGGP